MIFRPFIFNALLVGACGFALWRGARDAKMIGLICLAATAATYIAMSDYAYVEIDIMMIDLATLIAFVWVALWSDRFWPLWIAGLQLTTSLGHVMKAIDSSILPMAYAAALRLWSYPILVVLAVGVWRGHRRAQRFGTNIPPQPLLH